MGIKDINTFLKKREVECFQEGNISTFSGKTIAIDSGILFMKAAARTHKGMIRNLKDATDEYSKRDFFRELMTDILVDIFFFIQHNCNVIVVFDGDKDPDKQVCLNDRRSNKEKLKDRIEVAKDEYVLRAENPLEYGLPDEYEQNLRKLRSNDFHFDKQYLQEIKRIFKRIGIPYITAEHDAEFLCCSLVKCKIAHTVYTVDTDCYAFGIGHMITSINIYRGTIEITNINVIVRYFEQEFNCRTRQEARDKLRDFCIMCGCDFNTRVYRLGPANAFKLMKEYGEVENIPQDLSSLNYELCVEKFTPYIIEGKKSLNVNIPKLLSEGEEIVQKYHSDNLGRFYSYIRRNSGL